VKRRVLALSLVLVALVAACDRVIDLSRKGLDASEGPDTGTGNDGGLDGAPGDGGVDDGGGGAADV
jgi:hypothetical protein